MLRIMAIVATLFSVLLAGASVLAVLMPIEREHLTLQVGNGWEYRGSVMKGYDLYEDLKSGECVVIVESSKCVTTVNEQVCVSRRPKNDNNKNAE